MFGFQFLSTRYHFPTLNEVIYIARMNCNKMATLIGNPAHNKVIKISVIKRGFSLVQTFKEIVTPESHHKVKRSII